MLASGAGFLDATIRLWDAATGRPLGRLEGQRGWTSGLAFLADGKHLVSSSADQTLRPWDLESRTAVRAFRGHKLEVHALALSADQRTLLSGCKDGSVNLWDLTAERGASAAGSLATSVDRWVFADGGNAIVTVGEDGRVVRRHGRMFQEETPLLELELGLIFAGGGQIGARVIFDRKSSRLAAVTDAGKLQVWDWEGRALVREWSSPAETLVRPVGFSADGIKVLVVAVPAGTGDPALKNWDIATGREVRSINFPSAIQDRTSPVFSPDGTRFIALRSRDEESVSVDLASVRLTSHKLNLVQPHSGSTFSPDGRLLVIATGFGPVRIFDAATYREIVVLTGFMFGTHGAGYSPDQERPAIGSTAFEAVTLWDVHSYERLLTLPAPAGGGCAGVFAGRQRARGANEQRSDRRHPLLARALVGGDRKGGGAGAGGGGAVSFVQQEGACSPPS